MKTKKTTTKKATSKTTKKTPKTSADAGTKLQPGTVTATAGKTKTGKSKIKLPDTTAALALIPASYQVEETSLPIDCLTPGPNYATREDDGGIMELGDSIRAHGVQTRLWVRPLAKPTKGGATHEIIAGERRYRAAKLHTELLELPVKIFTGLSDEQAYELNLLENVQREGATPIDEAYGFKRLIDAGYVADDDTQPERSLRHRTGKSRTYIYATLKLCDLNKTGQEAVRKGQLNASVATRIARIPNPEAQKKATADAIARQWTDEEAARAIADQYMTELKGAPFDRKDPTLNPARGACDACPFRSGNQAQMFPEFAKGRQDICTDPTCFRKKCGAAFERQAEAHAEAGGKVLSKKQAIEAGLRESYTSITGAYDQIDAPCYDLPGKLRGKPISQVFKAELKADPTLVTLAKANDGSERVYELIHQDTLKKLLKQTGKDKAEPGDNPQKDYEREAKERKQREGNLVRYQLGMVARTAEDRRGEHQPAAVERAIARWLIHERGREAVRYITDRRELDIKAFKLSNDTPPERVTRALEAHLDTLDATQVRGLLLELMVAPAWTSQGELGSASHTATLLRDFLGYADPADLYEGALEATPGCEEILQERAFYAALTEPIAEILAATAERRDDQEMIADALAKRKDLKDLKKQHLDQWWDAAGRRDGRFERPTYDTIGLKAATVTEAPQI